ncbi:MAG: T9SS type A sorting domain-containing protein, partial [Saprospiraceae bacterium]
MTGVKSNQRYAGAKLIEAYPNPCADQVRIAFESEGGMVIIELLNQEGRLVQTVFNGYLESGHFDIACSMQKIPEGIYYLRIQNSVSEQVRKLIKARL